MQFKQRLWGLDPEKVNLLINMLQEQFEREKNALLIELNTLKNENKILYTEIDQLKDGADLDIQIIRTVMQKLWQEYFTQTFAVFEKTREFELLDLEFSNIEQTYIGQKNLVISQLREKLGGIELYLDSLTKGEKNGF